MTFVLSATPHDRHNEHMADMMFVFGAPAERRQAVGQVRKMGFDHEIPQDDAPDRFPLRVTGVPDSQRPLLEGALREVDPAVRMRHDT
jgi:hypothetical protein